jgi:hypothetical protein
MRFLSRAATCAAITLTLTAMGSAGSLAEGAYELSLVPPAVGAGLTAFRLNVATGQVSNVSGPTPSDVQDLQPIPVGEYRLYFTETPDNKTFWLYRLETHTGRTWFDGNNTWSEIK